MVIDSPTAVHPRVIPIKNVREDVKKSEPLKIVTPSEIQIHETEATPRNEELMEISPRSQEAQESEPDDSHETKSNRQFNEHHAVQDLLEEETFQHQNQNDDAEHEGDHEEPASPRSQHSQPDSNDDHNAENQRIPSHHVDPMQQSMILDENENVGDHHEQVFHSEAESTDEDHRANGHYENDEEDGVAHFEAEERKLIHENEDFPIHSANQDELNAFGENVHRRLDSDHETEEIEHSNQSHGFQNNAPKTRYSSSGSSQDAQRDNQKRASICSYEGDATVM